MFPVIFDTEMIAILCAALASGAAFYLVAWTKLTA